MISASDERWRDERDDSGECEIDIDRDMEWERDGEREMPRDWEWARMEDRRRDLDLEGVLTLEPVLNRLRMCESGSRGDSRLGWMTDDRSGFLLS